MSKKKKRRSNNRPSDRTRSTGATLADDKTRNRNRMNPTARNMLFFDLVFLSICQILSSKGILSDVMTGASTLIGLALLLWALWIQFGKKNMGGGSGGSRGPGSWPM